MKTVLSVLFVALSVSLFAQKKEVTITEEIYTFSIGSKNAITIILPDSKKDVVNKSLVKEIKSWGGKMKSSKTEITTFQSIDRKLFDGKSFDSYAKIYQSGQDVKISIAIDLGGAFLSSSQHPDKFNQMKEKLYKFAIDAGNASLAADSKAEEKLLKTMNKDLKSLDKNDASYKKNIESNENSIRENNLVIDKKREEITSQEAKIKEIKKTKVK